MLVSGIQQSDSVTPIHIPVLFQILFQWCPCHCISKKLQLMLLLLVYRPHFEEQGLEELKEIALALNQKLKISGGEGWGVGRDQERLEKPVTRQI